MPEATVKRTLVKSPPELWAEISDADALARHLGEFGGIRITRTDPETTVAWEGDRARGTVEIEESGWGTKVTLTAEPVEEPDPVEEEEPPAPTVRSPLPEQGEMLAPPEQEEEEPAPAPAPPPAAKKPGFWARLFGRKAVLADTAPDPVATPPAAVAPEPEAEPEPEPVPVAAAEPEPVATTVTDPLPAVVPPLDAARTEEILNGVLDDLGAAHHRPFSR